MDRITSKMSYLLNKGTVFLFCVMTQAVFCLPIVPDSVQNSKLFLYSNSLPSGVSSPVLPGPESLVQYSLTDKPSGQKGLAKQNGAQLIPVQPQSAKHTGSKSSDESPGYTAEHIVNSTNIHSSPTFNSNQIGKHSKKSKRGGSKTKTAQIPLSNSQVLQYESKNSVQSSVENANVQVNFKVDTGSDNYNVNHDMKTDNSRALQLAVRNDNTEGGGQPEIHETMITVGTSLAALFSLGVIIGIFGCCCKKKVQSEEEDKADKETKAATAGETNVTQERSLANNKKPSEVFNTSDIPTGEKDLDDAISFKDKIKALDQKLIIQPSPDKRKSQLSPDQPNNRYSQHSLDVASKRKSQNDVNMADSVTGLLKQPKIVVSEEEDKQTRDRDTTRTAGDNISKSDTQDDISDKIFDNLSMHSSTSQPFNPDVVVADTDDEDEFAEIQRGTTILKSFQRAKPPRNRSPATRTSKGKIRKSRPNLGSPRNQRGRQDDREPASTPSSASVAFSMGTSDSKTNSLEKAETKVQNNASKNNSLEKTEERKRSVENNGESPTTKSGDFINFDSIMSKSITSIGSDIVTPMKRETGKNGKYAKSKDSPKRERKESPARVIKSKEREITEKDKRNESPNRNKKSKDSPVEKRKGRRKDNDRHQNRLSSDISEDKPVTNASVENRLSGIPANASNNIFYLIDPTVKNKCKSVGDVTGDKRTSGDYSKHAQKAMKHKREDNQVEQSEDGGSAVKRERTYSDPNRKSAELKTNTR